MDDHGISIQRLRDLFRYERATGHLYWRVSKGKMKPGDRAGCVGAGGYWIVRVDGRQLRLHRVVWAIVHGRWPEGEVDHKFGDKSDNRLGRLRDVTGRINSQNIRRPHRDSKTGILGVSPKRGKFRAGIGVNGKQIYLGTFSTIEWAVAAREAAKLKYHPEAPVGNGA